MSRILFFLVFLFGSLASYGGSAPRLVVNIQVAGLRYDYLLKFEKGLSPSGVKRLGAQGAVFERAILDYMTTSTPCGVASVATGTTPSMHGVIGTSWYDYTTNTPVSLCHDKTVFALGGDDYDTQVSPRSLVATTIGDCIKNVSPTSKVISIAVEPTTAVIAGGFLADAAYWVNPRNGSMVSSTYYLRSLPHWVLAFNNRKLGETYATQRWQICRKPNTYYNVLRSDVVAESSVLNLSKPHSRGYDYDVLRTTPAVNSLIKDFAVQTILAENLGKDESTDYLNIVFEGPKYCAAKYGSMSMEIEDVIYRLDDELSTLLSFLEYSVGADKVLVVFSSAHGTSDPLIESSKLPRGRFSSQQFEILINSFLGAQLTKRMTPMQLSNISGDQRWVLDFVDGQLYLNRRRILESGFSVQEVQEMVAQFAIQFGGVAEALTASSMQHSQFTFGVQGRAQRSYFARHSGDVVLNLLPGWIFDDTALSAGGSPYIYDTHTPMIFWGSGVRSMRVTTPATLCDIAPTIAYRVGVTAPNASTGTQFSEIFK